MIDRNLHCDGRASLRVREGAAAETASLRAVDPVIERTHGISKLRIVAILLILRLLFEGAVGKG